MNEMGRRLRKLREGIGVSQMKLAATAKVGQATITRFETGTATPSLKLRTWYVDYFDVSMDYLCYRTDNPQGKLYEFKPKALNES